VMVVDYIEGETLTVASLRSRPALMAAAIAAIKNAHEQVPTLSSSPAADMVNGYDLQLLDVWRGEKLAARARALQRLLQRSVGRFDELVSCHQDLTPANMIEELALGSAEEGWTAAGASSSGGAGKVWLIDWEWAGPGDRCESPATTCAGRARRDGPQRRCDWQYSCVPRY